MMEMSKARRDWNIEREMSKEEEEGLESKYSDFIASEASGLE
jgi:hypothetical protein